MRNVSVLILLLLFAAPLAAEGDKVVVLGVDALDQRLMDEYMAEGALPNFQRLAREGHYSALESSYPPMSPVAWATMTTGLNPGQTGIFGFIKRRDGSYEPELALARPNEQPFAGGDTRTRLPMSLLFTGAVMVIALLIGKAATLIQRVPRRFPPVVPACVAVAIVLASPVAGINERVSAVTAIAGIVLGVMVLGYFAAAGQMRAWHWLFPALALWFAGFAFLSNLPETLPRPVTARTGTTFWKRADDHGVRARVIGAPVNWPAREDLAIAKLTTGLATPDAMGTFHTYTLFTEPQHELAGQLTEMSGRIERLSFEGDRAQASLLGPPAKFDRARWQQWEDGKLARMPREEIPFAVARSADGVRLEFGRQFVADDTAIELKVGEWRRHVRVVFDIGGLARLHGTVSFKLLAGGNQVRLYATPVNFDPSLQQDAFRVSEPIDFAPWLVEQVGMFETVGWAEATSALQDGAIDDETFLETCHFSFDEKRAQILEMLKHDDWDLLAAFTYDMDRICHMMWRHMDAAHPAHDPHAPAHWKSAIRDWYIKYDGLIGEITAAMPQGAVLLVCSDHGFLPFYRAVNLNRWLRDNGYLVLKGDTGAPTMEHLFRNDSSYYGPYDWSKTRAYALGLSKIYINLKGREPEGIVEAADAEALKAEIIAKLTALRDVERGNAPVISGVWRREDIWEGPRLHEAGDLQIGYASGYRVSWQTSLGGADEPLIFDNLRKWSGDHCSFDPKLVPGVVFSNRKLEAERFRLLDVGLTAINHLGVPMPALGEKDGRPWRVGR